MTTSPAGSGARAANGSVEIGTNRLTLAPKTLSEVRVELDGMDDDQRAQLSADWLAQLDRPGVDSWTLGFSIVSRATGKVIGGCGFKGPPGIDGSVEIAYGIVSEEQGRGYATEAAGALVTHAFAFDDVRLVLAHTLSNSNASARVLRKCGFQAIGEVIDPEDGLVWRWERTRPTDGS